jgi:hypothetical protein
MFILVDDYNYNIVYLGIFNVVIMSIVEIFTSSNSITYF